MFYLSDSESELSCDTYTDGVYLDAPTEIGDYDGDGSPDLMVNSIELP